MKLQSLASGLERMQERLKADLAAEFTRHAYDELAPGNVNPWDSDGFYTARSAVELRRYGYPAAQGEHEFPVPADCPYWTSAHRDGGNFVRGFLRHAWLSLPTEDPTGVLAIAVNGPDARLRAKVGDRELEPLHPTPTHPPLLLWHFGQADPHGVLHLHCDSPVELSQPFGRVSCRVGKPFWHR